MLLLSAEFLFRPMSLFKPLGYVNQSTPAPRLAQRDQELSLVLIILNWALAAGFWCLPGFLLLQACLRDSINTR